MFCILHLGDENVARGVVLGVTCKILYFHYLIFIITELIFSAFMLISE